jgi:hypothetical protein
MIPAYVFQKHIPSDRAWAVRFAIEQIGVTPVRSVTYVSGRSQLFSLKSQSARDPRKPTR